ncbi:MAG TPA: hypothetical protein VKF37_13395, partial [Chloroflexota bacterium]|nr:hypothetical protein [Chloroflexota bacterium]
RLARCPLGAGVLDVPVLLDLCARDAPSATVCIELGALEARHVRLLEDEFWQGYPPRRIEEVLPVLRLREELARPADEDWQTPWERGEHGEALASFEMSQFEQSVEYLHIARVAPSNPTERSAAPLRLLTDEERSDEVRFYHPGLSGLVDRAGRGGSHDPGL